MVPISYLVTVHNESRTLENLLERLTQYINSEEFDEVVILDDFSDNPETKEILDQYSLKDNVRIYKHRLDNNYGAHKNHGIQQCSKNYVFQCDADELPPESLLGENLHDLLRANPQIEAFAIPRINDFRGVTEEHAKQWGWKLTISPTYKRPIVNFPDYQFRIFRRDYPRISFLRRLHEKIEGYATFASLPAKEEYALYHDKTIETQIKTNMRYNEKFTQDENKGHNVV